MDAPLAPPPIIDSPLGVTLEPCGPELPAEPSGLALRDRRNRGQREQCSTKYFPNIPLHTFHLDAFREISSSSAPAVEGSYLG
jgi:hypothetical protein